MMRLWRRNDSSSEEWLSAYLDDRLTPRERVEAETRLQTSPELQLHLQQLADVRKMVRSLGEVPAPRSFAVTASMLGPESSRVRSPRAGTAMRVSLAAAAFGALFLLGATVGRVADSGGGQTAADSQDAERSASAPSAALAGKDDGGQESMAAGAEPGGAAEGGETGDASSSAAPADGESPANSTAGAQDRDRLPWAGLQALGAALAALGVSAALWVRLKGRRSRRQG